MNLHCTGRFFGGAALLALSLGILLLSCKSKPQDPAAYSNALMSLANQNEAEIGAMNKAMGAADYARAETVRIDWEEQLEHQLNKAAAMGDFNGDDVLQNAVIASLSSYQEIVTGDYKALIALSSRADPASAARQEQLRALINQHFIEAGNGINRAVYAFEEAYNSH